MERRAFARGALTLLLAGAASAACSRAQVDEEPPPVPLPVALRVPGEESIPAGARGDLVRRGRLLAARTYEEIPELVGSDLHCTSCHMEEGTRANAGPWVGLASVYPMYRARAGKVITLEERIDECFERSMNGTAPAHDSPTMQAFVAYIDWLSTGVPRGVEVKGRGFAPLERPPNVDPDQGKTAYLARCASCHGEDGQGKKDAEGHYQFPPLWGDRTFNLGAGMARLDTAAAFVRHNMPLGQPDSLTATDAYDIAAYFSAEPRADFAGRAGDWPHGGKPRDARY